jgi:MFS-type transporter involved in bile tolerance (Atg22 family)
VFRQYRPGPRLPPGSNFLTISWKQVSVALVEIRQLPQTFLYIISVFLLADGIETTTTVVNILQAQVIEYSFLKLTYIGLVTSVCSTVSSFGFWYLQKHYNITTKRMYQITNVFSVLLPLYGMAGIWTSIGYKREVEFWLYGAVWGLTQAPYYAYIQALLSELTPKVSLWKSQSSTFNLRQAFCTTITLPLQLHLHSFY